MTNPYIPPHLRGRVTMEENSPFFEDRKSYDGITVAPGPTHVLSPKQHAQTFDRDYRRRNFDESIVGQYGGSSSQPTTMASQLQKMIAGGINNAYDWGTSSQGKAIGTAGLLSALAGGGLGAWRANSTGDGSPVKQGLLYALMAGGLGAGATGLMQHQFNEREKSREKKASGDDVYRLVSGASDLSPSERRQCLDALDRISYSDRQSLERMVKTLGGAAVGVAIMRFLKAKGLLAGAVGAIIGGMVGSFMSSDRSYNQLGQPRLPRLH